jgi:hypothetical protein
MAALRTERGEQRMNGRFGNRARAWAWAEPGRARVALVTIVATVAAAGGAFVVWGPGDGPSTRVRHDRGTLSADGGAFEADDEASGPGSTTTTAGPGAGDAGGSSPEVAGTGAGSGGGQPGGVARSTATSGPRPTGAAPGTTGGNDPSSTTAPGGKTTAPAGPSTTTTAPAAAGGSTKPVTVAPEGPGWRLLPQAPIAGRAGHSAVWTGREMVIWGGYLDADPLIDGAAYDPAARTWRKVPAAPLSPRYDPGAFWTGQEMVVFGGSTLENDMLADGAAWNPATNAWRRLPVSPLGPRDSAVVAWAGDRLVVWGGSTVLPSDAADDAVTEMRNDGAAWVAASNSWVPVAAAPIPSRSGAESVWAGNRLVVTGGSHEGDDDDRTDGAALDPVSGAWTAIAARPAPGSCGFEIPCAGVWTGTVALFPASGLAYDPAGDRWSTLAPYEGEDGQVTGEATVWADGRMLVWGTSTNASDDGLSDDDGGDGPPLRGGMYDPVANRWRPFPAGPLSARILQRAVWTGHDMLVWGGEADGETVLGDGAAYRPE